MLLLLIALFPNTPIYVFPKAEKPNYITIYWNNRFNSTFRYFNFIFLSSCHFSPYGVIFLSAYFPPVAWSFYSQECWYWQQSHDKNFASDKGFKIIVVKPEWSAGNTTADRELERLELLQPHYQSSFLPWPQQRASSALLHQLFNQVTDFMELGVKIVTLNRTYLFHEIHSTAVTKRQSGDFTFRVTL
jgi:hypothetical protein